MSCFCEKCLKVFCFSNKAESIKTSPPFSQKVFFAKKARRRNVSKVFSKVLFMLTRQGPVS
jgi:hypothetical protein